VEYIFQLNLRSIADEYRHSYTARFGAVVHRRIHTVTRVTCFHGGMVHRYICGDQCRVLPWWHGAQVRMSAWRPGRLECGGSRSLGTMVQ